MYDECKMDVVDGVGVPKKRLGTWDVGRSVEILLISKYIYILKKRSFSEY